MNQNATQAGDSVTPSAVDEPIASTSPIDLASREVREGAVSVGHLVDVLTLLDGGTLVIIGVNEFNGDAVFHTHTLAGPAGGHEPHGGQVVLALAADFERNLVV